MAPRIKDIASYLNISPATVSMALNNRPGIKEETRRTVLEATRILEYQMTSAKRTVTETQGDLPLILIKKHGKVLGETPFFSSLIENIENEAKVNGFRLNIHYINASSASAYDEIQKIAENSTSGLLLLATEMDKEDYSLLGDNLSRIVCIDNAVPGLQVNKVLINNFDGAYEAVDRLYKNGHQKIGYLHSKVSITNFEERYAGFKSAMIDIGLSYDENHIIFLDSTHDGAYDDMKARLLVDSDLPTAFFADNDIIAVGALKALKEKGFAIPKDISIIGFDDMPFCTMVEPNLSTIQVDREHIGRAAIRLLLQNNDFNQKIEIGTRFISRNSIKEL